MSSVEFFLVYFMEYFEDFWSKLFLQSLEEFIVNPLGHEVFFAGGLFINVSILS
jgi:hypothetical protein